MVNVTSRPAMTGASPFFIVRDLRESLTFYRARVPWGGVLGATVGHG